MAPYRPNRTGLGNRTGHFRSGHRAFSGSGIAGGSKEVQNVLSHNIQYRVPTSPGIFRPQPGQPSPGFVVPVMFGLWTGAADGEGAGGGGDFAGAV